MGLKDKLINGSGSPLSKGNGTTPPTPVGATDLSKLQYEYSINGIPNVPFNGYFTHYQVKPQPSILDLDGQKPSNSYDQTEPAEGLGNI
jgi:hypothetical protein